MVYWEEYSRFERLNVWTFECEERKGKEKKKEKKGLGLGLGLGFRVND